MDPFPGSSRGPRGAEHGPKIRGRAYLVIFPKVRPVDIGASIAGAARQVSPVHHHIAVGNTHSDCGNDDDDDGGTDRKDAEGDVIADDGDADWDDG